MKVTMLGRATFSPSKREIVVQLASISAIRYTAGCYCSYSNMKISRRSRSGGIAKHGGIPIRNMAHSFVLAEDMAGHNELSKAGFDSVQVKCMRNREPKSKADEVMNAAFENSKEQSKARRPVGR